MRRIYWVGAGLLAALSLIPLSHGQVGKPAPQIPPLKSRDLSKFTAQQRHFYLSTQRGAEWLQRANRPDGRFVNGFIPALRLPMEGESYLRQAGAAFTLARTAKFFSDDRATAIAKQAVLTLLLETSVDPGEATVRTVSAHQGNAVLTAGALLAAIHELPGPGDDLLAQGDQIANLLRKHLQADGSVDVLGPDEARGGVANVEAVQYYAGPALYGIIHSQSLRPAAWKLEAMRRARAYYQPYWKRIKMHRCRSGFRALSSKLICSPKSPGSPRRFLK